MPRDSVIKLNAQIESIVFRPPSSAPPTLYRELAKQVCPRLRDLDTAPRNHATYVGQTFLANSTDVPHS